MTVDPEVRLWTIVLACVVGGKPTHVLPPSMLCS
jgi:hypothetical protein